MATGETAVDDVTFDLISLQCQALKSAHDYGQNVCDARSTGQNEIASFFDPAMADHAARATKCHDFLETARRHRQHDAIDA